MTSNQKLLLIYLASLFFLLFSMAYCPVLLAEENKPESFKHLNVAKAYAERGLYEQAKTELEAGLKNDPQSRDILNNLGVVYLRLEQSHKSEGKSAYYLEKARNYFTRALAVDPNFSSAWNSLADTYYLSGNTQQAISYYKKALSLSPKNAYEAQTNLANAQRDSGLLTEAQNNYEKAIEINPLYAPAHNGYAELLLNKRELTQAYNEILEAIRLKPNYATAYYHLGLLESARGNKIQALKAYLLSLHYETNATYAQETQTLINKLELENNKISFAELQKYQAALCQSLSTRSTSKTQDETEKKVEREKWPPKAHQELSKLLKIHPDDPVLLNELGLTLFKQKKYSNAEKVLIHATVKSNHKLSAAYYNLGQVYLAEHNLTKAQASLEQAQELAIKQSENTALIENALAILHKQKGDLTAARLAYTEAIKSDGDKYPVFHYNLAILLEQMNMPEESAKEYKAYLRQSPTGLNAANARSHLKKIP